MFTKLRLYSGQTVLVTPNGTDRDGNISWLCHIGDTDEKRRGPADLSSEEINEIKWRLGMFIIFNVAGRHVFTVRDEEIIDRYPEDYFDSPTPEEMDAILDAEEIERDTGS
jgi:hypothetical protein